MDYGSTFFSHTNIHLKRKYIAKQNNEQTLQLKKINILTFEHSNWNSF